jgi:hypothetical protein
MIKVDARVSARAETVFGKKAFGDASKMDAESVPRLYYAQTETNY